MLKGIILIIGAATCWGMGGVAGQYLYQYHDADMVWLCMARQILAGCMFLLFATFVQKQDIFAILKADTLNIIEFSFRYLGRAAGFLLHHRFVQCGDGDGFAVHGTALCNAVDEL